MNIQGTVRPLKLMELRSTYRWGGGPDKTILNSALMHDKERISTLVVYLRSNWDSEFSIGDKARKMGLNYVEIIENKVIDFDAFRKIIDLIRKNDIDILHSRDYKTNLYALLIRKFFCKNIKIVTTAHGWVGKGLKLSLYYTLDKLIVASFDRNFILFKDQVNLFIRKPKPSRTVVIHNAIDPDAWSKARAEKGILRKEFSIPEPSKIIGYVGRIMPEKDILTMVDVADQLINRKKIDAFFILVGESKDYSYHQKILKKITSFNLQNRFLMIGTRTDLVNVYSDFDIFLMTSIQEGFPNSLLEAMAMEVPSVVSSIDGIPEIIENNQNGVLCNAKDVKAFSKSIQLLLNDNKLYSSIFENARTIIENRLSFQHRLRKMENAYESLFLF